MLFTANVRSLIYNFLLRNPAKTHLWKEPDGN
jgi:hypothetical protein